MKNKLLLLSFLLIVVLGACSKKEEVINVSKPAKQQSIEDTEVITPEEPEKANENELVYEVDGEKKTVAAETKSLNMVGEEIKVSDKFELVQDPNQVLNLKGKGDLEKVTVGIREVNKIRSEKAYQLEMRAVAGSDGPFEKFEHPSLQGNYAVALQGEGEQKKGIMLVKETGNKPVAFYIYMFKPYPANQEEVIAEIVAMLNTFK